MMIQTVLIIVLFAFPALNAIDVNVPDKDPPAYPSCFKEGTTWSTAESVMIPGVTDPFSCQSFCRESATCHHFTWYNEQPSPFILTCFLYDQPSQEYPCTNCVSGPQSCTCGAEFACEVNDNNAIDMITSVQNELLCQAECAQSVECRFYTYYSISSHPFHQTCILFSSCDDVDFSCEGCYSGPDDCSNISYISTSRPTIPPTTSTTPAVITTTTTSDCPVPEPQTHGDWFCPASTDAVICHLECDPGYVSNNATVITCQHGEWSSAPSCVAGVALITGGQHDSPLSSVEVYPNGQRLPNLPDHRFYHTIDLVDSTIILCGGLDNVHSCLELKSSHQWVPHSTTIYERYKHSSISALGQLHLLGGNSYQSSTEHISPSSSTWSEGWRLLEGNDRACTAKVDAELAIMTGGYHQHSVTLYNVTSGEATRLQDLISQRYNHGCCYVKEGGFRGLLVAGGYGTQNTRLSELYDIDTGEWSSTHWLTTERRNGLRMFVIGDQILASGGEYRGNTWASVERFNLTSRSWTRAQDMMEGRETHAVTVIPPSAVGFGPDY